MHQFVGWAVAILLAVGLWGAIQADRDKAATLAQVRADLVLEQSRTAALKRNVAKLEVRNATSRKALREALDANAPWAGSPVPDAVADGLCNTPGVRCAARTVRAPGD